MIIILKYIMNIEQFELKKPDCEKIYKLKLVNSVFYVLKSGKWVLKKFSINTGGYYQSSFNFTKNKRIRISLHRLIYYAHNQDWNIWNDSDENTIDHISIDNSNNDISNLRILTKQEQQWNKNAKGYCWNKRDKKWVAQIMVNSKSVHLGCFDDEEDAKQAYLNAKAIYHVI